MFTLGDRFFGESIFNMYSNVLKMTFSLESRILLIYTIKLFLSVYTCACMLKPLFETSLLILLDEL